MPRHFHAVFGLAVVLAAFTLPSALAAPAPAPAKLSSARAYIPHTKSVHAATIQSVDEDAVHLTLANGDDMDADIKPSSLCVRMGKFVSPTDFAAGEKVFARTRARASDGGMSLVLLADGASLLAIDAAHGKTLLGKILAEDDKYVQIQPDSAGAVPLEIHVTPKTHYRRGGKEVSAADFPIGASVAVEARGGSNGLPLALIVSDSSADAAALKAALKVKILSGVAHDVNADKGLLTVVPKSKPKETIAVTEATKIKVRKIEAPLKDIVDGMHVTARLGHDKDAAGHIIASSLSATEAPKKKTPTSRKTATSAPAKP